MNMARKYQFSSEEIGEIEEARKKNKNKRVEQRLKVLELRAKGMSSKEVSEATGFYMTTVGHIVSKYKKNGLEAITGNHYRGNHRNMRLEEEAVLLEPFKARAEKGQIVEVKEITAAYEKAIGRKIGNRQIYYVLERNGWRKVMPRSRHPKKADEEVIETSKKLTP